MVFLVFFVPPGPMLIVSNLFTITYKIAGCYGWSAAATHPGRSTPAGRTLVAW